MGVADVDGEQHQSLRLAAGRGRCPGSARSGSARRPPGSPRRSRRTSRAVSRVSPPVASSSARPADQRDGLAQSRSAVMLSSRIRSAPASSDLARPGRSVSTSTSIGHLREGARAPALNACGDPARRDHVVVLDHRRVGQRHPVVDAAAAAHRVLLQRPQARRGLAGVADRRLGALQRVGPARGWRWRRRTAGTAGSARCARRSAGPGSAAHGQQHVCPAATRVAVLDVPLDLDVVRADRRRTRPRRPRSPATTPSARATKSAIASASRDGRHAGHVDAAVQVLGERHVRDVLDLDRVQAGVGQQLRQRRVQAALPRRRRSRSRRRSRRRWPIRAKFGRCSRSLLVRLRVAQGRARTGSPRSRWATTRARSGAESRTTRWPRQCASSRSG